MGERDLELLLKGYHLTTANIYYGLPDYPDILQQFIWQEYDLAPKFPKLIKYLDFWKREIDAKIHSVTVAHVQLIRPAELKIVGSEFYIH